MQRNVNRQYRLENMEARELMAANILESEPNNTARTADEIRLDAADRAAVITGSIANRNDQDFFHLKATSAGTANLSFGSRTVIGQVSVEDAAGRKLFETEAKNGINSGSFRVSAGQDIFVRVRGKDKTTGNYSVQLNVAPPASAARAAAIDVALAGSRQEDRRADRQEDRRNDRRLDSAHDLLDDRGNDGPEHDMLEDISRSRRGR